MGPKMSQSIAKDGLVVFLDFREIYNVIFSIFLLNWLQVPTVWVNIGKTDHSVYMGGTPVIDEQIVSKTTDESQVIIE